MSRKKATIMGGRACTGSSLAPASSATGTGSLRAHAPTPLGYEDENRALLEGPRNQIAPGLFSIGASGSLPGVSKLCKEVTLIQQR